MPSTSDNLTYKQFVKLSDSSGNSPLVNWLRTLGGIEFKVATRVRGKIEITFTKEQFDGFIEKTKRLLDTNNSELENEKRANINLERDLEEYKKANSPSKIKYNQKSFSPTVFKGEHTTPVSPSSIKLKP